MTLFSILLFPLSSLWLLSGKSGGKPPGQIINGFLDYFLPGIIFFIPAFFITRFFTGFLSRTYSLPNIFLYHFFIDYFFFQILCIAACLYRFRNFIYSGTDEKLEQYFLFAAGFFTALILHSSITGHGSGDLYTLFFLPVSWLLLVALTVIILIFKDYETGYMKMIYIAVLFALPFISAFIPFYFYIKYQIICVLILIAEVVAGYILLKMNSIEL